MTADLTLVVVAKDHSDLDRFDLAHIDAAETVLIANHTRTSLSSIGNHYLEHARTPVVGLVHADCVFGEGALAVFAKTAMEGSVCGIVGVNREYVYCWAGLNPGPVVTMDSCSVFLRRDLGLRFDAATFNGLHCHVEDICMAANRRKIPVIVPAAKCHHIGQSNNAAPWRAEYQPFRDRLCSKWGGQVITT